MALNKVMHFTIRQFQIYPDEIQIQTRYFNTKFLSTRTGYTKIVKRLKLGKLHLKDQVEV